MKTSLLLSFILTTMLLLGCQSKNDAVEQLVLTDSLLIQDMVDSAKVIIGDISLKNMDSKEDSAYYYLVQTETNYRKRIPMESEFGINYSLSYYETINDNEKLARALFYKGVTTFNKNRIQQTIHLLKQAEELAEKTNNLLLKHKIYDKLSYYNGDLYEYELSKRYALKALDISRKIKSKKRQSAALLYLFTCYFETGQKDSALICANQCSSLLSLQDSINLPYLFFDFGRIYEKDDPQLAKAYLKKAIAIKGIPNAYNTLANIYLREDSTEKANDMWEQALYRTRNSLMNTMRIDIFNAMRQQAMEHGDYRQANALADSAANWMKQYYEVQQQDRLAEIQAKYDKKVAEQELWNKVYGWGLVIVVIGGLLITGLGYYSYQGMKAAKLLAETQAETALYTQKVKELEASGQANTKEVARLNRKINELQQRQAGILANGKRLYDALQEGAITVRWGKADFTDFIEYYKLKDLAYVNDLQTDYDRLSPKYMFFAILEHEGRTDEEIMHIMGIGESTMRSTRSRINSKIKGC
jgi:tetratricopeptide (TPR) repeat protein